MKSYLVQDTLFYARNDCERVAKSLNEAGISAVAYHAGLSDEQRTKCQEAWINDRYKVSHYYVVSALLTAEYTWLETFQWVCAFLKHLQQMWLTYPPPYQCYDLSNLAGRGGGDEVSRSLVRVYSCTVERQCNESLQDEDPATTEDILLLSKKSMDKNPVIVNTLPVPWYFIISGSYAAHPLIDPK